MLRAYRRYRRQAGSAWSDRQLDDPLVAFPDVTRALLDYFAARFDPAVVPHAGRDRGGPAGGGRRLGRGGAARAGPGPPRLPRPDRRHPADQPLPARRRRPAPADADAQAGQRPGARAAAAPPATSRASCTRPGSRACTCGAARSPGAVSAGATARTTSGPRCSSLVRAQVLKNAIIVPTGAKGAFVCRRLAAGQPEATAGEVAAEVRDSYQEFIRGLLDVTDNVVGRSGRHARRGSGPPTARTPTWSSRPTGARRCSPIWPTRSRPSTGSGWATPSRRAAVTATTTRPWASPPRGRGSRSSSISASSAWTPRRTRSGSSASATCRVTCSATACCAAGPSS